MNLWEDLEKIRKNGEHMREMLESEGVQILDDQEARDRLRGILVAAFFACYSDFCKAGDLCLVYPYSQDEQEEDNQIADCDGFSTRKIDSKTGKTYSAIGISVEAMDIDSDYAVLVLLHELCHMITVEPDPPKNTNDHTAHFHARLDTLIEKFNTVWKTDIVNDYAGLVSERPQEAAQGH